MNEIYFEVKGEQLLDKIGMSKAEFARRMGIQRQNVKALFLRKDLRVDYEEFEIGPEDIPTGDSVEDRRKRQKIIFSFYKHWRIIHPDQRMFNASLNDWIYVKHI